VTEQLDRIEARLERVEDKLDRRIDGLEVRVRTGEKGLAAVFTLGSLMAAVAGALGGRLFDFFGGHTR
jgi:hypothetical protein